MIIRSHSSIKESGYGSTFNLAPLKTSVLLFTIPSFLPSVVRIIAIWAARRRSQSMIQHFLAATLLTRVHHENQTNLDPFCEQRCNLWSCRWVILHTIAIKINNQIKNGVKKIKQSTFLNKRHPGFINPTQQKICDSDRHMETDRWRKEIGWKLERNESGLLLKCDKLFLKPWRTGWAAVRKQSN